MRFVDIAGPDGSGESVGGVVGAANDFLNIAELENAHDGPEDFFAGDVHLVGNTGEDGGFDEIAFATDAATAGKAGGALSISAIDVAHDFVELSAVDLGALGEVGGSTDDEIAAGDRVKVSIRPTDVRVEDGSGSEAVVQDAVLVGGHIAMKITSGDETVIAHVSRGGSFEPGAAVRLDVDSERIRVFSDGQGAAAEATAG